jgi:glycosyltransferase involved in cell wall biosynthesis
MEVFQKKNILILMTNQFGYHTDTYMYSKYLDKARFDVSYLCFDMHLPRFQLNNVKVYYVNIKTNRVFMYVSFFKMLVFLVRKNKFDLVFHVYTNFAIIVRLITLGHFMILDIRTGDLNHNRMIRLLKNFMITVSSWFYSHVTIISDSLAEKLHINRNKRFILPLGGEEQSFPEKIFDSLRILYVGTLDKRNIHETVNGLSIFINRQSVTKIHYDIIGTGKENEVSLLLKSIEEAGLSHIITYHGRKNFEELQLFFEKCNIGIVYVPINKYYDSQPSTKFFEYVLSGMPVIATNTYENRIVINKNSGVLCNDNPESFSNALIFLVNNLKAFHSDDIRHAYQNYTWKKIIERILSPYLDLLLQI